MSKKSRGPCGACSGLAAKLGRLEQQLFEEREQNRARERSILETAERFRVQRDQAIDKLAAQRAALEGVEEDVRARMKLAAVGGARV